MKTRLNTQICFFVAPALFAAACCTAADTETVSGSFKSNDTEFGHQFYAVKIVDGYAYRGKSFFDDSKEVTTVVLADKPIDAAAIAHAPDRRLAILEQLGAKANYVEWEVGSNNPTLHESVVAVQGTLNLGGYFTAAYKINDTHRIEGHIGSDPGNDYPTDLTFSLPIAKP